MALFPPNPVIQYMSSFFSSSSSSVVTIHLSPTGKFYAKAWSEKGGIGIGLTFNLLRKEKVSNNTKNQNVLLAKIAWSVPGCYFCYFIIVIALNSESNLSFFLLSSISQVRIAGDVCALPRFPSLGSGTIPQLLCVLGLSRPLLQISREQELPLPTAATSLRRQSSSPHLLSLPDCLTRTYKRLGPLPRGKLTLQHDTQCRAPCAIQLRLHLPWNRIFVSLFPSFPFSHVHSLNKLLALDSLSQALLRKLEQQDYHRHNCTPGAGASGNTQGHHPNGADLPHDSHVYEMISYELLLPQQYLNQNTWVGVSVQTHRVRVNISRSSSAYC